MAEREDRKNRGQARVKSLTFHIFFQSNFDTCTYHLLEGSSYLLSGIDFLFHTSKKRKKKKKKRSNCDLKKYWAFQLILTN